MTRTIEAVFDSFYAANQAVRALEENGLSRDMIDIDNRLSASKANPAVSARNQYTLSPEIIIDGTGAGAQIGAGVGSAIGLAGGLLAALGALPLPGISSGLIALAALG